MRKPLLGDRAAPWWRLPEPKGKMLAPSSIRGPDADWSYEKDVRLVQWVTIALDALCQYRPEKGDELALTRALVKERRALIAQDVKAELGKQAKAEVEDARAKLNARAKAKAEDVKG
jgi:hypothetical protein